MRQNLLLILLFFGFTSVLFAQDNIYEDLLREEVAVENPVYMPVLGIGMSLANYQGEISNPGLNFSNRNPAVYVNVSTFFDKEHYLRVNFNISLLGKLYGEQMFFNDSAHAFNFEASYTSFGMNFQYSFEPLIKKDFPIHPFIKLGVEYFSFTTKTDLLDANGNPYLIDATGQYRDPLTLGVTTRDYVYETDLRKELDWGLGDYSRGAFSIPVDFGLEFKVSDRSYLNVGYGIHFTFTDLLDHVSSENTSGIIGKKGNDRYNVFYAIYNYDLFSDAESVTVKKLFADIEFDYTMYGDEDNDWVFDKNDECPGTPPGVQVDSLGCPLDDDSDGVPNYIDQEPNTSKNVPVDDLGRELSLETILKKLNSDAVSREEVKRIIKANMSNRYYAVLNGVEIPQKFKKVDEDNDGIISYDEFINVLDNFFEFETDYTIKDLEELKNFFFAQ